MSDKIAGVCYCKAGAIQFPLGEGFKVGAARVERTPITGFSGLTKYKEAPVSPYIEIECLTTDDLPERDILDFVDGTITAEAANGKVYTLSKAFLTGQPEVDLGEGKVTYRFHGDAMDIQE